MADFAFRKGPRLELGHEESFRGSHDKWFGIKSDKGESIGHMAVRHHDDNPEHLTILNVETKAGPNSLGPQHVAALRDQLKEHYPQAKTVSGRRISGARTGGKQDANGSSRANVKLTD